MQNPKPMLAAIGLSVSLLFGLAAPVVAQDADPVATVNGEPISKALFDVYAKQRAQQVGDPNDAKVRETLINELVVQVLLAQQAEQKKLAENDPELAVEMELMERTLMARATVRSEMEHIGASEEEVKALYDQVTSANAKKEYHARHILVDDEQLARDLIKQLQGGADFAELASEHSKDKGSAAQGGDLSWFSPEVMVQPFSEAVVSMEKGDLTSEPVQTQFGWHIIQLDDVRTKEPPSLEEMRPQVTQQVRAQKFGHYIEELRNNAEVEIK